MISTKIRAIDRAARTHWTPKADGKVDTWRSFHKAVEAGITTGGDCDDLSTTVMQLLCEAGLWLTDGWLLVVDSNGDTHGDHLVGACRDELGGYWIVGDTLADSAYPAHTMKHKGIAFVALSNRRRFDGLPWQRVN